MWRAILRWFGLKSAKVEGAIDEASDLAAQDPHVMNARYSNVERDWERQNEQLKMAIGKQEGVKASLKGQLEELTATLQEDMEIKDGSWATLQDLVKKLQAEKVPREEIEKNPDVMEARSMFDDMSSTVEVLKKQAEDLEQQIQALQEELNNDYVQMTEALRRLEQLEQEKHSSVAKVLISKQKQAIADLKSGIKTDGSAEELRHLRKVVRDVEGQATASSRIAGTDTAAIKAKYKATAAKRKTDGAFDALFAGVEAANKAETVAAEPVAEAPVAAAEKKIELPGG